MLIDVDDIASWPPDVVGFLRDRYPKMRSESDERPHVGDYHHLAAEVERRLAPHSITAWHCTRLCPDEIEALREDGMSPLSSDSLRRRVQRRVDAGDISAAVADRFLLERLSRIADRCGRLWFCLTRASVMDFGFIGPLSKWGGEAVASMHERSANFEALLQRLGGPCIVELAIPVAALEFSTRWFFLEAFEALRGPGEAGPIWGTNCTRRHVAPDAVLRLITVGDPVFERLCPALRV